MVKSLYQSIEVVLGRVDEFGVKFVFPKKWIQLVLRLNFLFFGQYNALSAIWLQIKHTFEHGEVNVRLSDVFDGRIEGKIAFLIDDGGGYRRLVARDVVVDGIHREGVAGVGLGVADYNIRLRLRRQPHRQQHYDCQ